MYGIIKSEPMISQNELNTNTPNKNTENKENKRIIHRGRKINEVLDVLLKWKQLIRGIKIRESGKVKTFDPISAAELVGVPKKSLDDYLLIVRQGKLLGFDFQCNRKKKFGFLRRFVQQHKIAKSTIMSKTKRKNQNDQGEKMLKQTKKISKNEQV